MESTGLAERWAAPRDEGEGGDTQEAQVSGLDNWMKRKAFIKMGTQEEKQAGEQGEGMPILGIPSLRDLWDNHMEKKNHHWKRCWKLPEIQRNLTTTIICRVVQFMKYIICISLNTTYTLNKITIRVGSSDKYTEEA